MECVNNIKVDTSGCLKPCSGLIVTSVIKSDKNRNLEELLPYVDDYVNYKKITKYPVGFDGKMIFESLYFLILNIFLAFEWKNKLRFVRIFFDTPTFDRVTRDRAAKPVDMLSAIGGTMGLLTGFSIISGVEILYFAVRFIHGILMGKK